MKQGKGRGRRVVYRAGLKKREKKMNDRFELYLPLHRLWVGYISELLGLGPHPAGMRTEQKEVMPNVATMHAKLVKADFHGSIMTGERCRV